MGYKLKYMNGSASFLFALSLGITQAHAVDGLTLSDVPLFVKNSVDPNMLVTLDDSGSMAWAFVPDSVIPGVNGSTENPPAADTKRFKSSYYNAIYYNPDVTYQPPKNASGVEYTTSFTKAYEHGMLTGKGSRNLDTDYRVTWKFDPSEDITYLAKNPSSDFNGNEEAGVHAYYYEYVGNKTSAPSDCLALASTKRKNDDKCYVKIDITGDVNKQNFANWYSFYRTRVLATASAASLAFQAVGSNVRLGYQNLHQCDGFTSKCKDHRGNTSPDYTSQVRPFTDTHRTDFYQWLQYAPADGGTPLRTAVIRAGDLLATTDKNSPYATNPGVTYGSALACRPTYHIAMTDGLWNGDEITAFGNFDNETHKAPDGCDGTSTTAGCIGYKRKYDPMTYTASSPFKDDSSNSIADIVFSQWITDAQPNLPNIVPTYIAEKNDANKNIEYWNPRNDPAEWQHLTTFTVALGLTGFMTDPVFNGDTFGGDYANLANGTKTWPKVDLIDPKNDINSKNRPYDLWHAAINGRGKFFSAESPNALVDSFTAIIAGITDRNDSAASVALDSGIVSGLKYAYHASFSSDNWTGDLKSYELLAPNYTPAATATWSAAKQLAEQLKNHSATSRNIKIANTSGSLVNFSYTNLLPDHQTEIDLNASLVNDKLGPKRVEYLRGESDANLTTGMRKRNSLLGDIIHSSPTYVGAPKRIGMDTLEGLSPTAKNSYATFKSAQTGRTPMVYFGANDGMLHGLNATTGDEIFAFIPTEVIPNLRYLTYNGYTHHSYVDGPSVTADIFDGSKWRTILVGTLRNGGKSVFALDVTDPLNIQLLWEFTDPIFDESKQKFVPKLGNVYGKPAIVRLHNNQWGVLIGNGYNSYDHQARLYVLNAVSGAEIKHFDTKVGDKDNPNGMAAPSPVDINGDLVTDYVYAGDLKGNLWRFDLFDTSSNDSKSIHGDSTTPARNNATNTGNWKIGYGEKPLFVAKDGASPANLQPITSNVVVAPHETGTGIIVMFGTGKYLESNDAIADTSHAQTYYGIWDQYILNESEGHKAITIARSDLQEQTLSSSSTKDFKKDETSSSTVSQTVRAISKNEVKWRDSKNPKQGWYLDFTPNGTKTGEMLVTDAALVGNGVFFSTTTPNVDPCAAGVDGWIFGLDAQSGGRTTNSSFDLNADGKINHLDKINSEDVYSSIKRDSGFGSPSTAGENMYLNEKDLVDHKVLGIDGNNLRRSWRIVR